MRFAASILLCFAMTAQGPPRPLQQIQAQSVELAEVSTDRLRLRVHLGGVAEQDIVVRALAFDDASLNGVPVFLQPMAGPVRISKGMRFADAGVLHATVFYRDLPSLEPVRRMVREEKVLLRATVRLQPELKLIERVALWASHPFVSWKVEKSVAVQLPGGGAGKTAALVGLAAADAVWIAGQRGLEWRRERDVFVRHVRETYAPRVLPVETRYSVVAKDGRTSAIEWRGLGFHLGDGDVSVPAEAVEPWMFEASLADALAAGDIEVIAESLRVRVGSYDGVKIASVARDRVKGLSVERRKTYAVRQRASMANVARLEVAGLKAARVKDGVQAGVVAVFRLRDGGGVELLLLSAAMENGRVRLLEPVDSRAFGSPVIAADGFAGIVVDAYEVIPASRL